MPALVVFGRRWHIGSDDLVIPTFLDLMIRITWLIIAVLIYWDADFTLEECPGQEYVKMDIYAVFTLLHLTIFADIGLLQNSKIGGCMDVEARKNVPTWIYARFFLQLVEIGFGILASMWSYNNYYECGDQDAGGLICGIIVTNWILTGVAIVLILVTFDPLGSNHFLDTQVTSINGDELPPKTRNTRLWELRCRLFACGCTDHPDEDPFTEAAKIIGTSMQGVDLTFSDLVAGLEILCLRNTRQSKAFVGVETREKLESSISTITSEPAKVKPGTREILQPLNEENWDSLPMLNHFLQYIMAAYTWRTLHSQKNPLRRMWTNSICCSCLPWRKFPTAISKRVEDDNCCFCNMAAIKTITQTKDEDILLASFKNDYYETQFFVLADHQTKTIVVSICGTTSRKDSIIDLTCWPVPLEIPGLQLPANSKVHHGFLQSAKVLNAKLKEKQVLTEAFEKYPGYGIVLIGHSLGAANATILGLMLREEYPGLKCYAFSPPGACLSIEAAEHCSSFVTSVTYGHDLACRITIQSCEKLKEQISHTLSTCTTPKYRILLRSCCILSGSTAKSIDEDFDPEGVNTTFGKFPEKTKDFKETGLNTERFQCARLYPPGRMLHITERLGYSKNNMDSNKGLERWQCRWTDRKEFEDIIFSTRMGLDHLPYRMAKSLRQLAFPSFTENQ